jgi:hypothetical protein
MKVVIFSVSCQMEKNVKLRQKLKILKLLVHDDSAAALL